MHSIGYTDDRNTHPFAACWKGFFWCNQYVHHTRSTARFWQNTTSTPSNATRARQNAAPGRRLPARRQGRAAVEERGVSDRILNEWCAPFVSSEIEWVAPFDEYRGCERADCGLSFYPSCSAILRRRGPHSVRYRAGEGASKGCCSKMGHFLATPTSARNAPSATPGDRARARHCVSELFCVRDDLAEIAAIKG